MKRSIVILVVGIVIVGYFVLSELQNYTETNTNYVEVKYKTIGWFYGFDGFNYTYLVLNVSITNHGYTQVNPHGSIGFKIIIGESTYDPLYYPSACMLRNETKTLWGYVIDSPNYVTNLGQSLPSESIKLRDTGTIAGLIAFKFGDPNIVPQPPQIFRVPFTLRYSVTYGESGDPSAQAIVKVIEVT